MVALLGIRALQLIGSLLQGTSLDVVDWLGSVSFIPPYPAGTPVGIVVRIVVAIFLVATLAAIVGMLRHEHWGWTMAIVTTGSHPRARPGLVGRRRAPLPLDGHQLDRGPLPEPARRADHLRGARGTRAVSEADGSRAAAAARAAPALHLRGDVLPDVGGVVRRAAADLLEGPTLRDAKVAIPAGSLTLESLAAAGDPPPGQAQFLRFTPRPLESIELARWRNRPDRQVFSAPGRLARVGLAARLVDAGLVLSLLPRGRVPGGTAAAASVRYDGIRAKDPTRRLPRPGDPRGPMGRSSTTCSCTP